MSDQLIFHHIDNRDSLLYQTVCFYAYLACNVHGKYVRNPHEQSYEVFNLFFDLLRNLSCCVYAENIRSDNETKIGPA